MIAYFTITIDGIGTGAYPTLEAARSSLDACDHVGRIYTAEADEEGFSVGPRTFVMDNKLPRSLIDAYLSLADPLMSEAELEALPYDCLPNIQLSIMSRIHDGYPVTDPALIRRALTRWIPAFREIRRSSGLTQQKIADRFMIPRRSVENWDSGTTTPPPYVRLMLMQLLGLIPQE